MQRCFIGISLPKGVESYVVGVQDSLRKMALEAKFVEPENLHISLSFLGHIGKNEIPDLSKNLDLVCGRHEKFEVSLGDIRLVPNKDFVRVIVLDVYNEKLDSLREDVVKTIGGDSKPPHLTLCRIRERMSDTRSLDDVKTAGTQITSFNVEGLVLFESILRREGPVYKVIHKSELR